MTATPTGGDLVESPDVLIVGAGLAGLGMVVRLREAGQTDVVILERADEVGGTWRENTYPGCACDVASPMYSYSFAPNPSWSRMYAGQPEILDYIRRVTKDYDIDRHIRYGTEAVSYRFDEAADRWVVRTRSGSEFRPRVVVMATGVLNKPNVPDFRGIENYTGAVFHSANWDHSVDLAGKRVAVIGTGASAVQFIPEIVGTAAHLDVFQRNAHWILPKADRRLGSFEHRMFAMVPFTQRLYRMLAYWTHEVPVLAFLNPRFLKPLEIAARRMLDKQIPDPELRAKLLPTYQIGCKRILLTNDYLPTLMRPDVDLITSAISTFTKTGIRTVDGRHHKVDVVILGTGFTTDNRFATDEIMGRDEATIQDAWRDGMTAYLGMTVAGFPNMFLIMGPNSGGGAQSILFVIENQIRYIVDCLRLMKARQATRLEVRADVERSFNARIHAKLAKSVWNTGGCHSWFLDHTGHNRQSWPGTGTSYRRATRRPDERAFVLSSKATRTLASEVLAR
jgi:cation diffusion facilitator CzcD-associated flavoprotein CzcO